MRIRLYLVFLCLILGIGLTYATSTKAEEPPKSKSKLELHLFYGTVMNRFSHRPAPAQTGGAQADDTGSVDENYNMVGIQYAYELGGSRGL